MDAPHNVKLVADVALRNGDRVLLSRYRNPATYDGQTGWFLPNDLLVDREDPADAARRVLRDQLGVQGIPVRIAFAESFTGRDRTWHLAMHFVADCDNTSQPEGREELLEWRWFALDELPASADVAHGGWALHTLARITNG